MIILPEGTFTGEESLDDYYRRGGYQALRRALERQPAEIVEEVVRSGLRGRGGAGFPTGKKWSIALESEAFPRYVVANGGEDEPGSMKDRMLMEQRPHLVLEGLIIAGYAVRAEKGFFYINQTFERAVERIATALEEAHRAGLLGEKILGSTFSFDVEICSAPTNYVAGEDTAALEVIEGRAPLPRPKPPYPAAAGLYGKPTVVNNIETFANVPPIIKNGAEWYRSFGTADSPGTMLFTLGEEAARPGVYELPFGAPMRELVYERGGGLRDGRPLRAVLPGGPSSGFLPAEMIDMKLEPDALRQAGSALGCGVFKLYGQGDCLVEALLDILSFFARESCGQCPACRMETGMLAAVLERLQRGQGNAALFDQFEKVLDFNRGKGYCSLINMPGPPVRSALRYFRSDFESHLNIGACPKREEPK